jgi:hypothetical protein
MHPMIPLDQRSPLDGIMEDAPPRDEDMPKLDQAADARNRKLTVGKPESELEDPDFETQGETQKTEIRGVLSL